MLKNGICIVSCPRCIYHKLVDLRHLEEEYIEAESLGHIYLLHLSIYFHFSAEVVVFPLLERCVYKSFVQIEHQCLKLGVVGSWKQWLDF